MNANQRRCVTCMIVFGMLCFLATAIALEAEPSPPMATPVKVPNGQVHVQLRDGSILIGKMNLDQTFTLAINFGEIKVSPRKIISFEFDDKGSVRIRSLGGDIYTGKLDTDTFSIDVPWGNVKIPQKHIKLIASKSHVIASDATLSPVISVSPDGRVTTAFIDKLTAHELAGTAAQEATDEVEYDSAFNDIAEDLHDARSGSRE